MSIGNAEVDNPLYVDYRAGSVDLIAYPPIDRMAEVTTLDAGDVMFVGNGPGEEPLLVGVECKKISDLISSINTGRLQATQLPPFLETYRVRWLLTYGEYGADAAGRLCVPRRKRGGYTVKVPYRMGSRQIPYGYVEALLMDLAAVGVHHKHCADEQEAARWLGVLHRWWSKPWSEHKGLHAIDESGDISLMPNMDEVTAAILIVAKRYPGLGYKRALLAAQHFESVIQMTCAPTQDWLKIKGIGKVVADGVVDFVRRKKNGGRT